MRGTFSPYMIAQYAAVGLRLNVIAGTSWQRVLDLCALWSNSSLEEHCSCRDPGRAFSVGGLVRGDRVTVPAAGGLFGLVFVAGGAGAMVTFLLSAAGR